ncbi:hypothetical protein [Kitasatospora purpeofusca]|uniref:hypothetical protein n=1 Tax=Kitasatospora purpeofusca TaxID=67352 RepID=UPI00225A44F9|nr:hypothetical protein [Kitasatospora purpeofusca]MCX4752816.1 hypothetical protein [Kitasatospora purpeofusca]WSR32369.1 hypothetical protein OG715_16060 [Kitasatospora purpeofusca]
MTTLDRTAADRQPSAPPAPPALDAAAPVDGGTRCSITAAGTDNRTGGAAGGLLGGSVPRPRDGNADGGAAASDSPDSPVAAEEAAGGSGRSGRSGESSPGLRQPPAVQERTAPVLRAAHEELRTGISRRPSPSRRLRLLHPQTTAAPVRPDSARTGPAPTAGAPVLPGPRTAPGREAPRPEPAAAEPPLGVLIGGTPRLPEAGGRPGRPEERPAVRATAELLRLGRGTCLVVLPVWRPAIAVSVPTEQLLSATGLAWEQLAEARLSVVINPAALHDRELELRDWQVGPPGRPGRRGRRRPLPAFGADGTAAQERTDPPFGM